VVCRAISLEITDIRLKNQLLRGGGGKTVFKPNLLSKRKKELGQSGGGKSTKVNKFQFDDRKRDGGNRVKGE